MTTPRTSHADYPRPTNPQSMNISTFLQHKAPQLVLFVVCILLPWRSMAQGFELSGESSLSGSFTLTIYDGDSTFHALTSKANKGLFLFTGQVDSPVLASLSHPSMSKPMFFYLENSEISIALNATRPEASLVKNSRSNSEYRYLLECYRNATEPNAFLIQYAKEHPASIYLPFVLHQQMSAIDESVLRQLITQVADQARHTYHYTLLRRWLRETPAVSEGSEMPNFAYLDSQKQRCEFNSSRNPEGHTLLFFAASWCDICHQQIEQAEHLISGKSATILTINIDDNPNGWDAHYLKQLSIDHLPYCILVDANGVVVARDIRSWELPRYTKMIK